MAIGLIHADWPAPPGVVAGTTTRAGGISAGPYATLNLGAHVGDVAGHVEENRRRFVEHGRLPGEPRWLDQVHGTDVVIEPQPGIPTADAMLTRSKNTVCAVMTADCLPLLLASTCGREVAAAHAGWRGLCGGVIENTVRAFSAPAKEVIAWLGPAISPRHFEVGDEVRAVFVQHDGAAAECFVRNEAGRWQADLYGLARLRLAAVGVRQVSGGDRCTFAEKDTFFSYRRDGQCGRMASFVFRYGESD